MTESEEMGRMGPYAEATETLGIGTSAVALAIRKDECLKKN